MTDEQSANAADAALVDQFLAAEDERRRHRATGVVEPSTIEFSEELSPQQREELSRMLECAERLEQLAEEDASGASWDSTIPDSDSSVDLVRDFAASDEHHIGNYRVLRLIDDGGFGAVLLAIDGRDGRQVALKVPRPDIRLTSRLQERFLIEGRAAAALSHPNIVAVLETLSDPVSTIVYEFCDGGTLSQAAGQIHDERTVIEIVLRLADALHHAHTRGILHRDVKPGNVLLMQCEGPEDGSAVEIGGGWYVPKLGDFGLAKVVDDSVQRTLSGVVMGTPQFMAPEQAAGRVSELGTHTDIFSLGAIFYWLLAGKPPFEGASTVSTLQLLQSAEPPPLRRLRRDLSAKTEAVCLKCLRKPIDARYESAAALADDLRNILRGEPVSVRPPRAHERLRAWSHRNPALSVVMVMLPLAAALGLLMQWKSNRSMQQYIQRLDVTNKKLTATAQQAEDARRSAELQQSRYAQLFYATDLQLAQRAITAGDVKTYGDALSRHVPHSDEEADLRGPEWQVLWDIGHPPQTMVDEFPSPLYCTCFSFDGEYLVACGADATIRVYQTKDWKRIKLLPSNQVEVNYASFSSDGKQIVSAGDDGTIRIWDWRNGAQLKEFEAFDDLVYCVKFYDNDTKIASCARDDTVRLWDASSGELIDELRGNGDPHRVEQLEVSRDGRWLATASFDGQRRVWSLETRKQIESHPAVDGQQLSSVALFSRDGRDWIISGTLREGSRADCSVILETIGEDDRRVLPIHFDGIQAVAADPEGRLAVAGDGGGRISLIDINAAIRGKRWWYPETIRKSWVAHDGRVFGLAISRDGSNVVSAGEDGKLICWNTRKETGRTLLQAELPEGRRWAHAVVRPGQPTFLLDTDQHVYRWEQSENTFVPIIDQETGEPFRIEFRTDRYFGCIDVHGDRLFGRLPEGPVCCWKITGSQAQLEWSTIVGDEELGNDLPSIYVVRTSDDGRQVVACRRGHPVYSLVLDATTGEILHRVCTEDDISDGSRAVAFDQSGQRLALSSDSAIVIHDLESEAQVRFDGHSEPVRQLAFVPGRNQLLSGADDRRICVWDLATGAIVRELTGHRAAIECLGIHPHRNRIISSDVLGWVRVWSLDQGMLLAELPPETGATWHAFGGDRLIGGVGDQSVFVQRLQAPR